MFTEAARARLVRISVTVAAAAVATVALVGCSSVVVGSGQGAAPRSANAPVHPAPPVPATSSPATTTASPVVQTEQPHICQERCRTVAHADLGHGYSVELAQAPGAQPISVIVLRRGNEVRTAGWLDDQMPGSLRCSTTPAANCIVVDGVGAHGSRAYGLTFADEGIQLYGRVDSDTPVILAKDLDHNGWIDAIAEESTERPSYATGPRYWVTFLGNGKRLMGTGCTTPTMRPQAVPTIVLTGDCA